MPEEINRIITDHLSSLLFVPSQIAKDNLSKEGIKDGVHIVGDIMYDALKMFLGISNKNSNILNKLDINVKEYCTLTLHRAENIDNTDRFKRLIDLINMLDEKIIFPVHPRTKNKLKEVNYHYSSHINLIDPIGYLDMLDLLSNSKYLITDSGGMQKEAYYLNVPCITLRDETEWVETVTSGWNLLVKEPISDNTSKAISTFLHNRNRSHPDLYGDGNTSCHIMEVLSIY
jgi:UDP-N-acetylglucosamine 2-epimerase